MLDKIHVVVAIITCAVYCLQHNAIVYVSQIMKAVTRFIRLQGSCLVCLSKPLPDNVYNLACVLFLQS